MPFSNQWASLLLFSNHACIGAVFMGKDRGFGLFNTSLQQLLGKEDPCVATAVPQYICPVEYEARPRARGCCCCRCRECLEVWEGHRGCGSNLGIRARALQMNAGGVAGAPELSSLQKGFAQGCTCCACYSSSQQSSFLIHTTAHLCGAHKCQQLVSEGKEGPR